jgi:hypothetical protein
MKKTENKRRIFMYLPNYIQVLVANLETPNISWNAKEAIFQVFGNLDELIYQSKDWKIQMEGFLAQHIFPELTSNNHFLKARALWVYGQFGYYPLND